MTENGVRPVCPRFPSGPPALFGPLAHTGIRNCPAKHKFASSNTDGRRNQTFETGHVII